MRKFTDGYDEVQVWSESMDAHVQALDIYKRRGWEIVTKEPWFKHGSDAPFRSVVRRKLKHAGDDRR